VLSLVCLGAGVYNTFAYGATAGIIACIASILAVPMTFILALKYIRYLPGSHVLAPPNPEAAASVHEADVELAALIGAQGTALSPLRPVGMCEFGGKRVSCVAESDMIDAGERVVGVGIVVSNLEVRKAKPTDTLTGSAPQST